MKPDVEPNIVRSILNRAFNAEVTPPFGRVPDGGSTQVYRVRLRHQTVYLRFGEEPGDSFAPEAHVHEQLRELGVTVPEVLFLEEQCQEIERSVMITAEVPGTPLSAADDREIAEEVEHSAGMQLARFHEIAIDGFGFINRTRPWNGHLDAPYRTEGAMFAVEICERMEMAERFLSSEEIAIIHAQITAHLSVHALDAAVLAHGDLDPSHIYQQHGQFSGFIDFGEIRGASRWHDLADCLLYDGKQFGGAYAGPLLDGYRSVTSTTAADEVAIRRMALFIGVRNLIRIADRPLPEYRQSLLVAIRQIMASDLV